jgi:dCTP deaminase
MMLKSDQIALRLQESDKSADPLAITPRPADMKEFAESGAASIDLRLGSWFVSLREARMSHLSVEDSTAQGQFTKAQYVPFGTDFFLHPRAFVLGVTLEWLRIPKELAGYVIGKSSWGRRGLIIATAAGVHPGFKGCLTLELSNVGEIPIAIKPGMTICQLCLHQVLDAGTDFVDRSRYIGRRKPTVGRMVLDKMASALAEAYKT